MNNIILHGKGTLNVQYYGNIYGNALLMKNFKSLYDSSKDLYIGCGNCAKKQYKNFIKVKNNG